MELSVVIIDDSNINLTLCSQLVKKIDGLVPICFNAAEKALEWCQANEPDMVIVDYMMPTLNGIEFISRFRMIEGMEDVPVIMVTANSQKGVRYNALEAGVTDFLTKPIDKSDFLARVRNMVVMRTNHKLLANRAAHLAHEVSIATATIVARERETIFRLAKAAEYRDHETGAHIMRMALYSRLIATGLGLPDDELMRIFEAAPMHDIGKVGTPDSILLKPGRLTPEEFNIMKEHTVIGHEILQDSSSPILQAAAVIAYSHHEKFDGSGYPRGLIGEAIPLYGRIVALADVFDALTSVRPYKKAWDVDEAAKYIREQSGGHFDPDCVKVFFDAWDEVLAMKMRDGDEIVE